MNKNETISYTKRFKPDYAYQTNKFIDVPLNNFKSKDESITDKEAYRVNLATLRGQLASGSGSPTVGSYSIPAGKEYDKRFDFSYLNRPDVTVVELDNFIENMKSNLENYDSDLKLKIQDEIKLAESKAEQMKKAELQKAELQKAEKGGNIND